MPLTPVHVHAWDLSPADARALQLALAARSEPVDRFGAIALVAGIDIGFEQAGGITRAAVAVLRLADLQPVECRLVRRPTAFPYIPGLLSFREIPAAVEALAQLGSTPELLLCDGQGFAHPRRFGLACHLGWLLDMPSIGVAKSRLIGHFDEPGPERGAWAPLLDRDQVSALPCARAPASSRCSSPRGTGSGWPARPGWRWRARVATGSPNRPATRIAWPRPASRARPPPDRRSAASGAPRRRSAPARGDRAPPGACGS